MLPKLQKTYSINVQASAENQILQLMNAKRVKAGLKPLTIDNTLVQEQDTRVIIWLNINTLTM
ncbi:MAG TPA: hypothetical protein VF839_10930 [Clostridium sp.]